jgi:hypothetical protein
MIYFRIICLTAMLIVSQHSLTWAQGHLNQLKGDYAFTTHVSFASDVDFDSTLARTAGGTTNSLVATGIAHYNGDGTGHAEVDYLRINHTNNGLGQRPVEQGHQSCSLTYQVNADQSFNITEQCTGTILAGEFAGQTTSGSPVTFRGRTTQNGAFLLMSDTVPDVETRTRFDGVNNLNVRTVGGRSGVAIKIK